MKLSSQNSKINLVLDFLNPNSRKVFNEIVLARKNNMWISIIVFSMAILDNILNDDDYSKNIDGILLNKIKYSNEIYWLRKTRNRVLHFSNYEDKKKIYLNEVELKKDSEKSYKILMKSLTYLFDNKY